MLDRLGAWIVQKRWWIIAAWVIAGGLVIGFAPDISKFTSVDQAGFLPDSYESSQARELAKKVFPTSSENTAVAVFTTDQSDDKLSQAQQQAIMATVMALNSTEKIEGVKGALSSPQMLAKDQQVQLAQISLAGQVTDDKTKSAIKDLRSYLDNMLGSKGITSSVTGQAAILADTESSLTNAERITGIATILLILILPGFIFRSPIAALLPVVSIGLVYAIGNSLLAYAADIFNFELFAQLNSLLIVVLFGIGTDYILFLLFRYREILRSGNHTREAVGLAAGRSGRAILSAGLVVLAAFCALFFAGLGSLSALAPGLVITVAIMVLASLTLIPSVVAIIEEKVFWPSKKWMSAPQGSTSKRLGRLVAARPGITTLGALLILLGLGSGIAFYEGDFNITSSLPNDVESVQALNTMQKSFPAGFASPTLVYVSNDEPLPPTAVGKLMGTLSGLDGVEAVMPAQASSDGKNISLNVILADDPASAKSLDMIKTIREKAHNAGLPGTVLVGGETAMFADLRDATNRDMAVILPIAAAFIFVILAILLGSLLAPLLMLAVVGLVYAATLGASTYIFSNIGDGAGLTFMLPIILYCFVVAIGTDYNILVATRLREEEANGHEPRKIADMTIEHSTATVVSAGVILAGTFLSLALTGISLLAQMGVAIALGISIAAFLASTVLLPSISVLFGRAFWWPRKRD